MWEKVSYLPISLSSLTYPGYSDTFYGLYWASERIILIDQWSVNVYNIEISGVRWAKL